MIILVVLQSIARWVFLTSLKASVLVALILIIQFIALSKTTASGSGPINRFHQ
jgi:hypothetical protein